jgi:hypothetical protein
VIPCYLTIACDDISALNLFCNPRSPRVRLSRVLRYLEDAGESDGVLSPCAGCDISSTPFMNAVVPQTSRRASIGPLIQTQQAFASNAKLGRKIQQHQQRTGPGEHRFSGVDRRVGLGVLAIGDLNPEISEGDGTSVSNAVWWLLPRPDEEGRVGKEGVRTLQGEIHLPSELQPSCPFPLFNISVSKQID